MWGLWQQNVGLNQLQEVTEMLCFVAKWRHERKPLFYSQHHHGREEMVRQAHALLDDADVLVHFNGRRFDEKHLNREFLWAGLTPPAPFQRIDLLDAVKRRFAFPSNKLAYVSEALGLDGKVTHSGHELWVRCMAGEASAWEEMKRYNTRDVTLLEELHDRLLPWIPNHPNVNLYTADETPVCPACGGKDLIRKGYALTTVSKFQRYRCLSCGKWSRSGKRVEGSDLREVAA